MIKLTHIILRICIFTSFLEFTTKHVIHIKKYSIQKVIMQSTRYIFFGLKKFKHINLFKEKKEIKNIKQLKMLLKSLS